MDINQVAKILQKIPFFEEIDEQTLRFIAVCVQPMSAKAGTIIFREGDEGHRFYVIIKGSIEIYQTAPGGSETVLAKLPPPSLLGEMSLLDDLPRSASAKALEDSLLLTLTRADFQLFLEKNFSVALKLLATLSKKLRIANDNLAKRKRVNCANEE